MKLTGNVTAVIYIVASLVGIDILGLIVDFKEALGVNIIFGIAGGVAVLVVAWCFGLMELASRADMRRRRLEEKEEAERQKLAEQKE